MDDPRLHHPSVYPPGTRLKLKSNGPLLTAVDFELDTQETVVAWKDNLGIIREATIKTICLKPI